MKSGSKWLTGKVVLSKFLKCYYSLHMLIMKIKNRIAKKNPDFNRFKEVIIVKHIEKEQQKNCKVFHLLYSTTWF